MIGDYDYQFGKQKSLGGKLLIRWSVLEAEDATVEELDLDAVCRSFRQRQGPPDLQFGGCASGGKLPEWSEETLSSRCF